MADWNPSLYLKYGEARTRPAAELAAAISLTAPARVLDVGCGPGNSTAVLAARFPGAAVTGVDSSPAMVAAAKVAYPQYEFKACDISSQLETLGCGWDVIFSNACLQWVPDHKALVPALYGLLAPGGVLAVQVPQQQAQPVHTLLRQLAASPRWCGKLAARPLHLLTPAGYWALLARLTPAFRLWETVYYQTMESQEALLEWYRGTGLRPYLAQLAPEDQPAFEADVLAGIRRLYPADENGRVLFPFPRLFFLAEKER